MAYDTAQRHFDPRWERIYATSEGQHLNRYPFGDLVSVFFRCLRHLDSGTASADAMRVLELGCGAGNNLMMPLNEGMGSFGVDGSISAIRISRDRCRDAPAVPRLCVADFCYLPYAQESFDLVIDRESVCSNDSAGIERVFAEVARVLKPGGLYLSFMYSLEDGHRLQALAEPGLAVEIEPGTFSEFREGTFAGTGRIHFFSREEIEELCRGRLEILGLSHSRTDQLLPEGRNLRAEYILVARK